MRLLLVLMAWLYLLPVQGQYTLANTSTSFDVHSGTNTGSTISVDGITFQVYESNGRYVKLTHKNGHLYPYWIGKDTGILHNGKEVRASLTKDHFYLKVHTNHLGRISLRKIYLVK